MCSIRKTLSVLAFFSLTVLSGQELSLVWEASAEQDLAGYKVYVGRKSRKYDYAVMAGLATEWSLEGLEPSGRYYFAVTAFNTAGNESLFSGEAVFSFDPGDQTHFSLGNNYPNPFNPVTSIPFTLYRPSEIHMAVYDVIGREVRVLLKGEQVAGHYVVSWDGTDRAGRPAASGVYFCRLLVGSFCQIRKLLLTR